MYIKLTRFDNTPVWINAAFIVTIEPRRQAMGSIVVPIGDGLDYEVRENPDQVLAMLEGAPVAAIVPVPPPKSLTKAPDDASAEPMTMTAAAVLAMSEVTTVKEPPKSAPVIKVSAPVEASAPTEASASVKVAEPPAEKTSAPADEVAPAKPAADENDVFARSAVPSADPEFTAPVDGDAEASAAKKPAKKARKTRAKKSGAEAVPTAEQIERLRKMAPGSVKKLANTITSQLKLADPDSIIDELAKQGVLTLDHDHVIWN